MSALEEHIAHLQRALDELSDVVARQEAEIATLNRRVEMLMKREGERAAGDEGGAYFADQRPPHW